MHQAHAYIELQIARMARSVTPGPDRSFIEGMIEMSEYLQQITGQEADAYRQALAIKHGNRVESMRKAA